MLKNNILLTKTFDSFEGFIYIKENAELIIQAEKLVNETISELFKKNKVTFSEIKNTVRNTLSTFLFHKTRRNPMIIPVIMNRIDNESNTNFNFVNKDYKPKKNK